MCLGPNVRAQPPRPLDPRRRRASEWPRGRRDLVDLLLPRPVGTDRRTGLHHQGVTDPATTCHPCSRFILLPVFPVAQAPQGRRDQHW